MRRVAAVLVVCLALTACASPSQPDADPPEAPSASDTPGSSPAPSAPASYDLEKLGVPRFVTASYIDPAFVGAISKFRSGIGHDYSDNVESCRSMKHYFQPRSSVDWRFVPIVSPVNGTITDAYPEWAGVQLRIRPDGQPFFTVVLFHVTPSAGIGVGSVVTAGQSIGKHVGYETMSDVAIQVDATDGYRLVSYFDAMDDATFAAFQARGIAARGDAIITKSSRDSQPLTCNGQTFTSAGTLEHWVSVR